MSYSFRAKAASKDLLEIAVRDKLSEVPKTQPVHEADIDQAFNAAKSLIDLVQDDPDRDVVCDVAGSIYKTEAGVQNVSVNVSVSFAAREAAG